MKFYILDDNHTPQPVSHEVWSRWIEPPKNRVIKQTWIRHVLVSTVFLGMDHNWSDQGPPLIFETMIFGLDEDHYQTRCSTYAESLRHHTMAFDLAETKITALELAKPKKPD